MERRGVEEPGLISYLWYTAIWYLLQYLIITGLHYLSYKEFNKHLLQKAASDTLILSLVFIVLQWSQGLLASALYRLPLVAIHVFVDFLPTMLWLTMSQVMMLASLGLIQKLYHSLSHSKFSLSEIRGHLGVGYFTTVVKSQQKLEDAIYRHTKAMFPRFVKRYEERSNIALPLAIMLSSVLVLCQLSTIALIMLNESAQLLMNW